MKPIRHHHAPAGLFVGLGLTFLLLLAPWAAPAAQEEKIAVGIPDLPVVIQKALEISVPAGEILEIEREVQGEDPGQYDVMMRVGGTQYEIEISPEGKVLEKKQVAGEEGSGRSEKRWTCAFRMEECTFGSVGRNRFFILEPGYQLILESASEKVVITVLDQTRRIRGIETRIVEEQEEEEGTLKEGCHRVSESAVPGGVGFVPHFSFPSHCLAFGRWFRYK